MMRVTQQSREEWLLNCIHLLQQMFEKQFNRFTDVLEQKQWLESNECKNLCIKMESLHKKMEKESCCV